jgi:hypothetical protein
MRDCMFCGGRVSTKEDAWPLWLLRRVRADGPGEMSGHRGGADIPTWKLAKSALPLRFVCRGCNNGWMSDLESRARLVIEPLLGDEPHLLTLEAQQTVAVWAVKSAMVYEALRLHQPWVFTADERRQLRSSVIPPQTKVWIAKVVNLPGACCAATDLFSNNPASSDQERAYVTTMAFGPLALQVLNFRLPYSIPDSMDVTTDVRPGPWRAAAAQVWPIVRPSVPWPPPIGLLGQAGFDVFCERWKPLGGSHRERRG